MYGTTPERRPDQFTRQRRAPLVPPPFNGTVPRLIVTGGTPPSQGLYVYSPAVAAGDLLASIAATSGFDVPGNAVLGPGVASYVNGAPAFASLLGGGQLSLWASPGGEAGSYIQHAVFSLTGAAAPFTTALTADSLINLTPNGAGSGQSVQVGQTAAGAPHVLPVVLLQALGLWIQTGSSNTPSTPAAGGIFWTDAAGIVVRLTLPSGGGFAVFNGDVRVSTGGKGLGISSAGGNPKAGTATLVAGTVTVANTNVTANSIILLGGTVGAVAANAGALFISSATVGTGFTIKSTNAADTSTVGYVIVEQV